MLYRQLTELYEILDSAYADGKKTAAYLEAVKNGRCGETAGQTAGQKAGQKAGQETEGPAADCRIETYPLRGEKGTTDMVRVLIPGRNGKTRGGNAPTIGILGRLGGLGARPELTGFVSDGDGALTALAVAAKLLDMKNKGDELEGDVFVSTHVCPDSPTMPHEPVPFMDSPVGMKELNREEVGPDLDAILVVDTTKGNRIINCRGFAISPTVREGYILPVSEDLLSIMQITSGRLPQVFALSQQDITPYGNGLYHLNSIMQPCTVTSAPVVGVAITTETMVPGCATGATHLADLDEAARFMLEAAKSYTAGKCAFCSEEEFALLKKLYGDMSRFQAR